MAIGHAGPESQLATVLVGSVQLLNPGTDVLTIRNSARNKQTAVQIMPNGDACREIDLSAIMIYAQDVGPSTVGPFNRRSQRYAFACGDPQPVLDFLEHYRDKPPSEIRIGWRDANSGKVRLIMTLFPDGTIDFHGAKLTNFVTQWHLWLPMVAK